MNESLSARDVDWHRWVRWKRERIEENKRKRLTSDDENWKRKFLFVDSIVTLGRSVWIQPPRVHITRSPDTKMYSSLFKVARLGGYTRLAISHLSSLEFLTFTLRSQSLREDGDEAKTRKATPDTQLDYDAIVTCTRTHTHTRTRAFAPLAHHPKGMQTKLRGIASYLITRTLIATGISADFFAFHSKTTRVILDLPPKLNLA